MARSVGGGRGFEIVGQRPVSRNFRTAVKRFGRGYLVKPPMPGGLLSTQAGVGFHKRRTETKFEKSKSQKVEKFLTFRIFLHCTLFGLFWLFDFSGFLALFGLFGLFDFLTFRLFVFFGTFRTLWAFRPFDSSTFRVFLHFSDLLGFSTFRVFWHFSDRLFRVFFRVSDFLGFWAC